MPRIVPGPRLVNYPDGKRIFVDTGGSQPASFATGTRAVPKHISGRLNILVEKKWRHRFAFSDGLSLVELDFKSILAVTLQKNFHTETNTAML
jgi:hypothetical protein